MNIQELYKEIEKLDKDAKFISFDVIRFDIGEIEYQVVGTHTLGININSLVNENIVPVDAYNRFRVLACTLNPQLILKLVKLLKEISNDK